jgi:hypothetical protein
MGAFPSQSGSALGTVAEESQFWQDHPPGSKRPDRSAISPWWGLCDHPMMYRTASTRLILMWTPAQP